MSQKEGAVPVAQASFVGGSPQGQPPVAMAHVVQPSMQYTGQGVTQGVGQPGVQYVVQTTQISGVLPAYYGSYPQRVVCPFCRFDVVTGTVKEVGCVAHLWAMGLCFVGCWPFCLLPYCMDSCKDTVHICPNCHQVVGASRSM